MNILEFVPRQIWVIMDKLKLMLHFFIDHEFISSHDVYLAPEVCLKYLQNSYNDNDQLFYLENVVRKHEMLPTSF